MYHAITYCLGNLNFLPEGIKREIKGSFLPPQC